MSYPDSVRFLYSLGNELKAGARFSLEPLRILLAALGHPERGGRFVHVAGTNGKGSVSAAIASVLYSAGFNTGLYTSPHLQEPTERIQINGRPVSPDTFSAAFDAVHACAEQLLDNGSLEVHPSYFETVTAMAFLLFHNCCQISVIEVGLGGRLDATNVITPELCVITPISYDHEAYLGNTLGSIATEKAGILKPGIPVVLSAQVPEAHAVIEDRAREVSAPVLDSTEAKVSESALDRAGWRFFLDGEPFSFPLPGRHQIGNAVCAILACRQLNIADEIIRRGLGTFVWPGRLETVQTAPDFILDGAHNPAGASALAAYIREFCSHRPVWIVYGAMRDKAIDEVTDALFPLARHLILTAPDMPRALRPEAIAALAPHPSTTITQTILEAVAFARTASPETVVFFTGSLFVVGEARSLLLATPSPAHP